MYDGNALQIALLAHLNGNVTGTVHDHVLPDTPYPYTVIGELTETVADLHDRDVTAVIAQLHVWSAALGMAEINTILGELDGLLHHQTIPLAGNIRCWSIEREFSEVFRELDDETGRELRHGVVRYNFGLQEIPA